MWEFYFVGFEVPFATWGQMVFQMQIAKQQHAVPMTRDYMFEWEQAARQTPSQRAAS